MEDRLFKVSGNKINTMLLSADALRLSSQLFTYTDDFKAAWEKKVTLATKLRIRYDSIRSITKEEQEGTFLITYKTWAGFPSECEFSFLDHDDYETFYEFMEKELYFVRTDEVMRPFKAISRYLLGLAMTIFLTACAYIVATDKDPTDNASNAEGRLFTYIVGWLGVKGVLAIGGGICCYIGYMIWKRYRNPPNRVKFVRA